MEISSIKNFVVIGTGTMGREIAQVALMAGFKPVILYDISFKIMEEASNFIERGLTSLEKKGLLPKNQTTEHLMGNLLKVSDFQTAVENADFLVEAIPEIIELKQNIFHEANKFSPSSCIFATNTSTMSITKIAELSGREDKVVGMHFFIPIPVLRLIEVIKGQKTSEETMDITVAIGQKLPCIKGKRFIARVEKESPGFIVNRLTIASNAYLNWLVDHAFENKISFEKIDADVVDFGLGPCAKMDYLGLETIYNVLKYFSDAISPDFAPGKVLTKLVKEGNLGRKTGKGFCEWKEDGQLKNPSSEKAGLFDIELFMALQLNEGCRLLEEGVVSGYKTIDDTMLAGMSMPGPFGAGKRNYKKWAQKLEEFVQKSGKTYFLPCELMKTGGFIKMRK